MFYVYEARYPSGIPFYVGKGSGNRIDITYLRSHNAEVAKMFESIKSKGQAPKIEIVFQSPNETEAFKKEAELISLHGRQDMGLGPLLNRTAGTLTEIRLQKCFNLKIDADDHHKIKTFCAKHRISHKELVLTSVFKHMAELESREVGA